MEEKRFWKYAVHRFFHNKLAVIGGIIVLTFLAAGILAPWIAPNNPIAVDLEKRLLNPCFQYPFGTDQMGRCIFSRILYGTRVSLVNALIVLAGTLIIAVPIGIWSGYTGGFIDNLLMRISDMVLTLPTNLVIYAAVGVFGTGSQIIIPVFIMMAWAPFAKMVRGTVIDIKSKDFVAASIASGSSRMVVVLKHILLNAVSPVIVLATLRIASIIGALSSLSFIGLGTQPPDADWGVMLNDGRQFITAKPMLMFWPGFTIMLAMFGLNMLGEGLNEALLPVSSDENGYIKWEKSENG